MQIKKFPKKYEEYASCVACLTMASGSYEKVKEAYRTKDYGMDWILALIQANKIINLIFDIVEVRDYKAPRRPVITENPAIISEKGEDAIICSQGEFLYYEADKDILYGKVRSNAPEISRVWFIKNKQ